MSEQVWRVAEAVKWLDGTFRRLVFKKNSVVPSGVYEVCGGLCFPLQATPEDVDAVDLDYRGYAVICGREYVGDTVTGAAKFGELFVMAEIKYVVIDNVFDETGRLRFPGLGKWFNQMRTEFGVERYYWNGSDLEEVKRRRIEIARSDEIAPKPFLKEIKWREFSEAMAVIAEQNALDQLRFRRDGGVHNAIRRYETEPDGVYPELSALAACMVGMVRYPSRRSRE
jgi:hypothetical protein